MVGMFSKAVITSGGGGWGGQAAAALSALTWELLKSEEAN